MPQYHLRGAAQKRVRRAVKLAEGVTQTGARCALLLMLVQYGSRKLRRAFQALCDSKAVNFFELEQPQQRRIEGVRECPETGSLERVSVDLPPAWGECVWVEAWAVDPDALLDVGDSDLVLQTDYALRNHVGRTASGSGGGEGWRPKRAPVPKAFAQWANRAHNQDGCDNGQSMQKETAQTGRDHVPGPKRGYGN